MTQNFTLYTDITSSLTVLDLESSLKFYLDTLNLIRGRIFNSCLALQLI